MNRPLARLDVLLDSGVANGPKVNRRRKGLRSAVRRMETDFQTSLLGGRSECCSLGGGLRPSR